MVESGKGSAPGDTLSEKTPTTDGDAVAGINLYTGRVNV